MNDGRFIKPIAYIRTDFKEKFGIPRQSGCVPSLQGKIVFLPEFRNDEALRGLDGYSHIWLLFDFSEAHKENEKWSPTVRPPRLGGNIRLGVFASRSPFRPNSIGLSCVKLEKIEKTADSGTILIVSGIDLLDMTPIYDIKPYLPYADSHPEASGGFATDVYDYKLDVNIPDELLNKIPIDKQNAVIECLSQDIRPAYHNDENRIYTMNFAEIDISFTVKNQCVTVTDIKKQGH